MADIKISCVTPRHFYESVQLLRTVPYSFRFSRNSLTIEFDFEFNGAREALNFARLEHLGEFLRGLENSSVPVDLDDFVKTYNRTSKGRYFRRRLPANVG